MVKFICIKPAEYKLATSQFTILYGQHECPFGKCLIAVTSSEKAVCHLRFVDNDLKERIETLKSEWPGAKFIEETKESEKAVKRVFSYKDMENVTVYLKGTDFQLQVLKALVKLPKGKTVGYEYVAELINNPKAIRAIAKTINSNQIAFIIPCHRVLSKSGPPKTCWRTDKRDIMLEYERKLYGIDDKEKD
ncbi:bifunctional transcriptional activator/DNA repair enzyme Ada [Chelonus insularis]|uniref:bifunctional transcriptional activator/DNA repair enzyme Ada n=1 Tax=Chelonus insularis TaxID=460826 RepID=UPI0015895437|nr:bifunctional transcriptional activator/DNA repair enzyme Ada [Chelonus insularis]